MSRLFAAIFVSTIAIASLAANAFGLPTIPGLNNSSKDSASPDLSGAQDQLVKQYVGASKSVLDGNAMMADALGLKAAAASARASGESMTDGATKGNLSDANKASSNAAKEIAEALKNPVAMDAESKTKFSSGLVSLAQGMGKYVGMKAPFDSFQKGLSNVSPMMLPKLQSGVYIVSSLPGNMSNLGSALSSAISFAKSQNIEVPANVNDVLAKANF